MNMIKRLILVVCVGAFLLTVVTASPDSPAMAAAPSAALCNGNNAFCGATLHAKNGSTSVIPSKSFGAHYGPGWSIPASANNSTGVGFCLTDQFTGVPVGPVGERPLAPAWTPAAMASAAWLMATYAGDRVSPYQRLPIDTAGELLGYSTRQRYLAVHLALLSTLPNWMGGTTYLGLLDPATLQLFSDAAGTNPSVFQSVVPLVQLMVAEAVTHSASGSAVVIDAQQTSPGLVTVTVTKDGTPVPDMPIWATPNTGVTYAGTTGSQAHANAVLAGWPSLDYSTTRVGAGVSDASGVATFHVTAVAMATGITFRTEEAPALVRNYGDGLNSQDNLTWLAGDIRPAQTSVSAQPAVLVASQISDTDPSVGDLLTDAIILDGLADGVTATVQVQLFDLTLDPAGGGTPLLDETIAGLDNGSTAGLAQWIVPMTAAGHMIGYRHRIVATSDGLFADPSPWSPLGIPSETGVVNGLVVAEAHLRKSVSVDGASTWINAQWSTGDGYAPPSAPSDPSAGSFDDAAPDAGDQRPVALDGAPVGFRYEVWLDEASTGVIVFPNGTNGVVTDDNGTPADTLDDFQPPYVSGDDGDGVLELGEVWVYQASSQRIARAGDDYRNYSSIPSGEVRNPANPNGPPEGTSTPRRDPAGYVVPSLSSAISNPADSSKYIGPRGGTMIDQVCYSNVVAGVELIVSGELQARRDDGGVSPSGIVGSTTFVPPASSGCVEVMFAVPESAAGGTFVAFQRLAPTATRAIVARHEDPDDADQTFVQRRPITVTTRTCSPMVTVAKGATTAKTCDRVTVSGDPFDVVTGSVSAYAWSGDARLCATPGATVAWTVTLDASGHGSVETAMVDVPIGSLWEWIETARTADGRTAGRNCLLSPRDAAESFSVRPPGDIPRAGGNVGFILLVGGGVIAAGGLASGVAWRRREVAS